MRLKSILVLILIGFISVITSQSSINISPNLSSDDSSSLGPSNDIQLSFTPHAPIVVTNDSEFLTSGFTGYGNESHPYILEGVSISTDDTCINISYTSSYYMIRNCFLNSSSGMLGWGIYLDSSPHGTIESSIISSKEFGMRALFSDYCTIFNNTFSNCGGLGIIVYHTDYSTVENNIVENNDSTGITIRDAVDVQVINNTVQGNQRGIHVQDNSEYCNLINNTVYQSDAEGIWLTWSTYCTLIGNDVFENQNGIRTPHSDHFEITDNRVYNNDGSGAILEEGTNGTLTGNEFVYNGYSGVNIHSDGSEMMIFDNLIGWNDDYEGIDDGASNSWDDGVSIGNRWGDYTGTGPYLVSGISGSYDMYPQKGDTDPPFIDPPDDVLQEYGVAAQLIRWSPVEPHPSTYTILINESEYDSGLWSGGDITVLLDLYFDIGIHNFTLIVYDTCANYAVDTVIVTVTEAASPTTTGSTVPTTVTSSTPPATTTSTTTTPVTSPSTTTTIATTTSTTTTATTTTTEQLPPDNTALLLAGAGGGGLILLLVLIVLLRRRKSGEEPKPVLFEDKPPPPTGTVEVQRGGEIVGKNFVYKVKVNNGTEYVINNVIVTLSAYPEDCMIIEGPSSKTIKRIENGGFRSPSFTFKPTDDCVKGIILATVSFIDHMNNNQVMKVEPFEIKSVCDLLSPMEASIEEYDLMLADMAVTSDDQLMDWNPVILFHKAEAFLDACNFHIMDSMSSEDDSQFRGEVRGLAKGKYTEKRVALRIIITGPIDGNEARVEVEALGDDITMLPVAIGEITSGIDSWTCLNCGGALEPDEVDSILGGTSVQCKYCRHTLTIHNYRKS